MGTALSKQGDDLPHERAGVRRSKLDDVHKRWRRLDVHILVSEDAPFGARRTATVKPSPRLSV